MTGPRHAERPEHTVNPDELEVAPGFQHETLQGWVPELASETEIREAMEKAFDYRGDVTITRKNGTKLDGYIFDRVGGETLGRSYVRVLPKDSNQRLKIAYSDIAALAFSGRDTAAGKSWEAWVGKYWQKKTAGEADIRIEPESLDE
jgi:aryl-alcohol dehydrogenase-like predicted oxidoreductase